MKSQQPQDRTVNIAAFPLVLGAGVATEIGLTTARMLDKIGPSTAANGTVKVLAACGIAAIANIATGGIFNVPFAEIGIPRRNRIAQPKNQDQSSGVGL